MYSQSDIDAAGWFRDAVRCPSPNYDARPPGTVIDLLVIHNISLPPGEFGGDQITDLFLNRLDPKAYPAFPSIVNLRVSSHLLIRRTGELIQYVACEQRAWHAGVSVFAGRERCNDFSLGIELEGADLIPFTDAQYQKLTVCTRLIQRRYPEITIEHIVGHSDISPGRKTDPGPSFDWAQYRASLRVSKVKSNLDFRLI